jgi:hypothetical protein
VERPEAVPAAEGQLAGQRRAGEPAPDGAAPDSRRPNDVAAAYKVPAPTPVASPDAVVSFLVLC